MNYAGAFLIAVAIGICIPVTWHHIQAWAERNVRRQFAEAGVRYEDEFGSALDDWWLGDDTLYTALTPMHDELVRQTAAFRCTAAEIASRPEVRG